jgi:glycosyltransferase involved in cell wall biosynthesis
MHPLLSIITVTKNCGSTIERTLESVREMKSSDIQYIVIDGESTDETLDIVRQAGDLVDILVSENDSGVYNAMNKGAALATGRYVLFLNGDDRLLADGFGRAMEILMTEKPGILCCRCEVSWPNAMEVEMLVPHPFLLPFFNTIPHLSTFISAEIQKKFGYREDLKIASDYDLFLRLFLRGYRFRIADPITAIHYRGGVSGDIPLSAVEIETVKRDNLGFLYFVVRLLQQLNRLRKRVVAGGSR